MTNNILDIKTIDKTKALSILYKEIDTELLSPRDNALLDKVALMIEQLIAKDKQRVE